MYNNEQICAIIVARKDSVRIKSKSMLLLNGETLIERKIRQLKQSKYIDRIILGSNSQQMLLCAKNAGAEIVKRPDFYCDEKVASANDMIRNMMQLIDKTDVIVWAHCTNPLIQGNIYDEAIQSYYNNDCDSLLSVVKLQQHLWNTDKKTPLNYNPYAKKHVCACNLPPYYMQDGGIFIQDYKQMKENSYFFGKNPFLFQIQKKYFLDINTMQDYLIAKAICQKNK